MFRVASNSCFSVKTLIRRNFFLKRFYAHFASTVVKKQLISYVHCHLKLRGQTPFYQNLKVFCNSGDVPHPNINTLSAVQYEALVEETLQSLTEKFEEILEIIDGLESDVNYSNGVLTVSLGEHGIYVINKQSPNKQIWLSSPLSGPKRYDFVNGIWIYKHDSIPLHELLGNELSRLLHKDVNFDCIVK